MRTGAARMAPLLDVRGLYISFGGIQALAGIDLRIEPEEILSVIGPNGSGKTTLFNCVSGVYRASGGEIRFAGESLMGLSPDAITT
jgi:branched-chain amino acid transport system ATP-binding protein